MKQTDICSVDRTAIGADYEFYQPNEGITEDVLPSCGDRGWMRGKAGALCLSWSLERVFVPQPGQAQGPRIHPTPPPVPTGRGRFYYLVRPSKIIWDRGPCACPGRTTI